MTELIKIPVENLKIGHYIVLPFGWKNHPFLFSSFRIKDEEQLTVQRDLGLKQIPVNLEKAPLPLKKFRSQSLCLKNQNRSLNCLIRIKHDRPQLAVPSGRLNAALLMQYHHCGNHWLSLTLNPMKDWQLLQA